MVVRTHLYVTLYINFLCCFYQEEMLVDQDSVIIKFNEASSSYCLLEEGEML